MLRLRGFRLLPVMTVVLALATAMKRKTQLVVVCVAVFVGTASQVSAAMITFNGTSVGSTLISDGDTFSEAGFSLDFSTSINGGAYFIDVSRLTSFPGLAGFDDDVLEFNGGITSFVLTKDDGGLFDLVSVETGSLGRFGSDDGDFVFTGTFGSGGTISQSVLAGGIGPTLNNFSGFTGLSSLTVTSTDSAFPVMDNINLNATSAIPEPSSMALLGLASIGGIGLRWRQRRRVKGARATA